MTQRRCDTGKVCHMTRGVVAVWGFDGWMYRKLVWQGKLSAPCARTSTSTCPLGTVQCTARTSSYDFLCFLFHMNRAV